MFSFKYERRITACLRRFAKLWSALRRHAERYTKLLVGEKMAKNWL